LRFLPGRTVEDVRDVEDVVGVLDEKSPATQMLLGGVLLAVGVVGSALLYEAGFVWLLLIAAIVVGAVFLANGFSGLRRQRALHAQAKLVLEHREEILQEVIAAKSAGGNPVALLRDKGITDTRVRQALLREARRRMAGAEQGQAAEESG